jgi:hypothetical protein
MAYITVQSLDRLGRALLFAPAVFAAVVGGLPMAVHGYLILFLGSGLF